MVMPDVRGLLVAVRLRLLHTEEGGRRTPITSARFGYRPNWGLPGTEHPREQSGAPLLCRGADQLHPGQTARAVLVPLFPEAWQWLQAGEQIHAYEGPRRVGQAEVLMISETTLPSATKLPRTGSAGPAHQTPMLHENSPRLDRASQRSASFCGRDCKRSTRTEHHDQNR